MVGRFARLCLLGLLAGLLAGCSGTDADRGLSFAEAEDGDAAFDDNVVADLGEFECSDFVPNDAVQVLSTQSRQRLALALAILCAPVLSP